LLRRSALGVGRLVSEFRGGITHVGVVGDSGLDRVVGATRAISTSVPSQFPYEYRNKPKTWPSHNQRVFPPQEIGEKPRPAVSVAKMNV